MLAQAAEQHLKSIAQIDSRGLVRTSFEHLEIVVEQSPTNGTIGNVWAPDEALLRPKPDGVPLKIAMFLWGDPETVKSYRALEAQHGSMSMARLEDIPRPMTVTCVELYQVYAQLRDQLVAKLRAKELVATGYDLRDGLKGRRIEIPAERWPEFQLNCEMSFAILHGMSITEILVKEVIEKPSVDRSPNSFSEADLEKWYIDRVRKLKAAGEKSTQEEDEKAARAMFGSKGFNRDRVRALRDKHGSNIKPQRGPKSRQ